MVDTRNAVNDNTDQRTVRFQFSNHLGSAALELDDNGDIISYEEYHPYGTTAYQALSKAIKTAAKRYRYTGMERDEENGLEYHSARYYLVSLGRWLSPDPWFECNQVVSRDPKTDEKEDKSHRDVETVVYPSMHDYKCDEEYPDRNKSPYPNPRENNRSEKTGRQSFGTQQPRDSVVAEEQYFPNPSGISELENLNLYAYGALNPMVYQDPSGFIPIMQAWYAAYDNASTSGKVGYGFLALFAWLAHVIVNLVVLVLSVTLFNIGGLFGAWDFTYGALQTSLGLGLGVFTILLGADVRPHWGMGAEIEMPEYMEFYRGYGVSLGPFTFGGPGFSHWAHEAGHTWQSRLLGPFYLFIIGIPSAAGAQYTEDWADAWAT